MFSDSPLSESLIFCVSLIISATCSEIKTDPASPSIPGSIVYPGKADISGEDSCRETNDPSESDRDRELAQSVAMVFNVRNAITITNNTVTFSWKAMSEEFQHTNGIRLYKDETLANQVDIRSKLNG